VRATFLGYKGEQRTQHNKYALIKVDGIDDFHRAASYIGRKAVWHSPSGGRSVGRVVGVHGKKGILEIRLRKGLPGEAVGT